MTCDAVSGPTAFAPVSIPSTVNVLSENDGEPPELVPALGKPPPLLTDGIVPENEVSVRTRPPLAAATPLTALTLATSEAGSVPVPICGWRTSRAMRRVPPCGGPLPKPRKRCGPIVDRPSDRVTVMSVPTP